MIRGNSIRFIAAFFCIIFLGAGCYTPPAPATAQVLKSGNTPAQCGSRTAPAEVYFEIPSPIYEGEEFAIDATCTTGMPASFTFSVMPDTRLGLGTTGIPLSPRVIGTSDEPNAPRFSYTTLPKVGKYTITVDVTFSDRSQKKATLEVVVIKRRIQEAVVPSVVLGPGKPPEYCGQRGEKALLGYFTLSNLNPLVGESITFDASCSVGEIVKVEWDVDMMECLERKVPGITGRVTDLNADTDELRRVLETCFERVVDVRGQQLSGNNFAAMFQTYTPTKPGTTRARVRLTDVRGRREVKHIVYTVHGRNAGQEAVRLAPLQFSLLAKGPPITGYPAGPFLIPQYPDNRTVYLHWQPIGINKAGENFAVSAMSISLLPVVSRLYGDEVEYRWRSTGVGPELVGEVRLFEIPWQKFLSQNAIGPGPNEPNTGRSLPLIFPSPAGNKFLEERQQAEKIASGFPADPTRPTLEELRFSRAFPYDVTLDLTARAGTAERTVSKKFQFVSMWKNTLFKTQLIFVPIPFILPLAANDPADRIRNSTGYQDYINLEQYYNQVYKGSMTVGGTMDELAVNINNFWYGMLRNPSPFVVDPGEKIYVSNYTVRPYDLDIKGFDPQHHSNFLNEATHDLGPGARAIQHWAGGDLFFAPVVPGAYTARTTVRLRSGEESLDELPYRVRELIKLSVEPAPLSGAARVGQVVTFGARASKGDILFGRWVIRLGNNVVYDSQDKEWSRDGGLLQYRFTAPGTYKVELTVTEAETFRQARKTLDYEVRESGAAPARNTNASILHITEKGVANIYDQNNLLFVHGAQLFISLEVPIAPSIARIEWDFNDDRNYSDNVCTVSPRTPCNTVETQASGACPGNGRCVIRVQFVDKSGLIVQRGEGFYRLQGGGQRELTDYEKSVMCPPESERVPGVLYEC